MRKASIWMSAVAVAALAAACGGSGNTNNGTTGTSGTANVNGGRTLTLRGCVEDGVPTGTYILRTNAPAQSGGATAGTSGSNGQASSGTDVNNTRSGRTPQDAGLYRLIATGNLDFGQNLGKEVTVTGEIASQARDNTVGTTGPAGGGRVQGDASDQNAAAHFFRVTSMNKVADSCEGR